MCRTRVIGRFVKWAAIVVASASVGCVTPTQFTGEPKVSGGPSGCIAKCGAWRMELVGMVSIGEYSDGCICRIPQRTAAKGDSSEDGSVGGAVASGAAVFVAMQEAQRQQQARQMNMRR
jgi:hypothetical protein